MYPTTHPGRGSGWDSVCRREGLGLHLISCGKMLSSDHLCLVWTQTPKEPTSLTPRHSRHSRDTHPHPRRVTRR